MLGEHEVIETTMNIFRDGHYIPENSSGVVVHVYKEGEAYEVEFPNIKNNPVILCNDNEIEKAVNE
jgi:hypothetical protein